MSVEPEEEYEEEMTYEPIQNYEPKREYDPEYDPRRRIRRRRTYDPARRRRRRGIAGIRRGGLLVGALGGIGLGFVADKLIKNLGVDLKGMESLIPPISAGVGGAMIGGWGGGLCALIGHVILTGLTPFWGKEAGRVGDSI